MREQCPVFQSDPVSLGALLILSGFGCYFITQPNAKGFSRLILDNRPLLKNLAIRWIEMSLSANLSIWRIFLRRRTVQPYQNSTILRIGWSASTTLSTCRSEYSSRRWLMKLHTSEHFYTAIEMRSRNEYNKAQWSWKVYRTGQMICCADSGWVSSSEMLNKYWTRLHVNASEYAHCWLAPYGIRLPA